MEAPHMTDDDVRDLFSAYHDGELSPEEHERVRVALEASPSLTREYEGFCEMLKGLSNLGVSEEAIQTKPKIVSDVDLLANVQKRIQKRSGGKFYKDRWSRTAGIFPLEVLAVLVLVAMVAAYFAMTQISIEPLHNAPAQH
jgi:anti-sigma factor RsiW